MSPDKRDDPFLAGSLWNSVVDRSKQALAQRALQPIPTTLEVVRDGHAEFHLRVLSHLEEKPVERQQQPADFNPFLPYDPALFVADISDTHVALLNKYNVVEHHLLVVTREFETQTSRLTQADFAAVARAHSRENLFTKPIRKRILRPGPSVLCRSLCRKWDAMGCTHCVFRA